MLLIELKVRSRNVLGACWPASFLLVDNLVLWKCLFTTRSLRGHFVFRCGLHAKAPLRGPPLENSFREVAL